MKQKKVPSHAILLSAFIPGLGQLYNGQPLKALFFFVTWITLVTWPFAVTDAWETATKINEQEFEKTVRATNRSNQAKGRAA